MTDNQRKVIWCEGMFLQPHHFQQQDRYWRGQLASGHLFHPYAWGFTRLAFDRAKLKMGIIMLREGAGILPDGTYFTVSDQQEPLPVLRAGEEMTGSVIVLALPLASRFPLESHASPSDQKLVRYRTVEMKVKDTITEEGETVLMQLGELNLTLAPESQVSNTHCYLPVAQIENVRADGEILLDDFFIPPLLNYRCAFRLEQLLDDFLARLRQRKRQLQESTVLSGEKDPASLSRLLFLKSVSQACARISHYRELPLHPEILYRELISLAGEWEVFVPDEMPFTPYQHANLKETFSPLMESLQRMLSLAASPNVISLPLRQEAFGIYHARLSEVPLRSSVRLILAIKSSMPASTLHEALLPRIKISTGEQIRDRVNLQLPGLSMSSLQTLPHDLPWFSGYHYFELQAEQPMSEWLQHAGSLAIHIAGEFPDGRLALWIVEEEQK